MKIYLFICIFCFGCMSQAKKILPDLPMFSSPIPSDKALVWFPVTWTVTLNQKEVSKEALGTPLTRLEIRSINLVLKESATDRDALIKLESGNQLGSTILDQDRSIKTFTIPRVFQLPEGEFKIYSVRALIVDPNSKKTQVFEVLVPNAFQGIQTSAFSFVTKNGRVSALPRIAIATTFGHKNSNLNFVTAVEAIDREFIPTHLVLEDLKLKHDSTSYVFAGSPDFPRLRVALTNSKGLTRDQGSQSIKVGFLFDVPCDNPGIIKMVWKKASEDTEYLSYFPLEQKAGDCEPLLAKTLELPKSDWILKNVSLLGKTKQQTYRFDFLNRPSEALKQYYSLSEAEQFSSSLQERDLARQFVIRANSLENVSGKILYLGQFEFTEDDGGSWETLFKRNYTLNSLKKNFSASTLLNAYTGTVISRSRTKGTVQALMTVQSASDADTQALQPMTSELRKDATTSLAQCLKSREEFDPLVNVAGSLNFTALKGSDSISVRNFIFATEGPSEEWVKECYQKRLLSFKFTNRLPANMQGTLRFASE